jgi:hypothetical protein
VAPDLWNQHRASRREEVIEIAKPAENVFQAILGPRPRSTSQMIEGGPSEASAACPWSTWGSVLGIDLQQVYARDASLSDELIQCDHRHLHAPHCSVRPHEVQRKARACRQPARTAVEMGLAFCVTHRGVNTLDIRQAVELHVPEQPWICVGMRFKGVDPARWIRMGSEYRVEADVGATSKVTPAPEARSEDPLRSGSYPASPFQ